MMKEILLSKGKVAFVDDEDYVFVSQWKWSYSNYRKNEYAVRRTKDHRILKMHREIMKVFNPKIEVDHVDGDGLNNQKCNLRKCTHKQNVSNQRLSSANSSGYKGVSWNKPNKKWHSYIKVKQKRIHLGLYSIIADAAQAYNDAAVEYFGEFANLNVIERGIR